MLLLITIALVLVAAITLLIGIFTNNLGLIYTSIGSSALAAIVLVVLSQINRRGRDVAPAPAPEPIVTEPVAPRARTEAPATTPTPATPSPASEFPIEGYDTLPVNQILPQLDGLNADELDIVAEHEESGKNRSTILNRIDQLLDEIDQESIEAEEVLEDEELEEAAAAAGEVDLPIENYDNLGVAQILPLLDDLDADELDELAEHEENNKNRAQVLNRIDELLDEIEGVAAAPAPVKKKAAAKKASVKKAGAAKKAPVKKAAAATKKTATKKKAAATKAPAKKTAPAKKASKAAKKR